MACYISFISTTLPMDRMWQCHSNQTRHRPYLYTEVPAVHCCLRYFPMDRKSQTHPNQTDHHLFQYTKGNARKLRSRRCHMRNELTAYRDI